MQASATLRLLAATLTLSTTFLAGCNAPHAISTQERSSLEQHLLEVDQDWAKAAATHNVDAWLAFYAPDAVVLPPNEKTADTPAAIRTSISQLLSLPQLNLSWQPSKVFVANAGDMAYLYGTYTLQAKDATGAPINDFGKIAEIWRKQTDGNWKCVLDTWSSDLSAVPPAPAMAPQSAPAATAPPPSASAPHASLQSTPHKH